jgi:hypothetical protein
MKLELQVGQIPWAALWLILSTCSVLVAALPTIFGPIAEHGKTSTGTSESRNIKVNKIRHSCSSGNTQSKSNPKSNQKMMANEIMSSSKMDSKTKMEIGAMINIMNDNNNKNKKKKNQGEKITWSLKSFVDNIHNNAKISKHYFTHMYVFSLSCCCIPLVHEITNRSMISSFTSRSRSLDLSPLLSLSVSSNDIYYVLWELHPLLSLLAIHSVRRLLECIYLTIFGRSQMHISGLAVGMLHYAAVVACFAEHPVSSKLPMSLRLTALFLFVFASIMQHRFHVILFRIKETQRLSHKETNNERCREQSLFKSVRSSVEGIRTRQTSSAKPSKRRHSLFRMSTTVSNQANTNCDNECSSTVSLSNSSTRRGNRRTRQTETGKENLMDQNHGDRVNVGEKTEILSESQSRSDSRSNSISKSSFDNMSISSEDNSTCKLTTGIVHGSSDIMLLSSEMSVTNDLSNKTNASHENSQTERRRRRSKRILNQKQNQGQNNKIDLNENDMELRNYSEYQTKTKTKTTENITNLNHLSSSASASASALASSNISRHIHISNHTIEVEYNYEVPRGSWFQYVCCPHYTAEILIYISFMLLSPNSFAMRCLVIWVTSNLAVTGKRQLDWYRTNNHLKNHIPDHWYVLIPGVW